MVTTALSKSLALGGWRIGVARLPDGGPGAALRDRLLGVGSEIWSAPAAPIQQAAAVAFSEPRRLAERIDRSRALHAAGRRAVASRFAAAGLLVPAPQAAFYVYPDFAPWREPLRSSRGLPTGPDLAGHLLAALRRGRAAGQRLRRGRGGAAAAGGHRPALRRDRRSSGRPRCRRADPLALPWIAAALSRIEDILADLAPDSSEQPAPERGIRSVAGAAQFEPGRGGVRSVSRPAGPGRGAWRTPSPLERPRSRRLTQGAA